MQKICHNEIAMFEKKKMASEKKVFVGWTWRYFLNLSHGDLETLLIHFWIDFKKRMDLLGVASSHMYLREERPPKSAMILAGDPLISWHQ